MNIVLVDETGTGLPELKEIAESFSSKIYFYSSGYRQGTMPAGVCPSMFVFAVSVYSDLFITQVAGARQEFSGENIPVLILAPFLPDVATMAKLGDGFTDFLPWPAGAGILKQKISFWFEFEKQRRALKMYSSQSGEVAAKPNQEGQTKEPAQLNQLKNEFLTHISHELRTPLNAIIGMTHLVLMDELSPLQKDRITDIKLSGEFLLHIIDEILNLSQIDTNIVELVLSEFNIANLVMNISRIVSPKAVKKKLKFISSVPENLPEIVIGDDVRISQVLFNLFDNAIKFTKTGEISLSVDYEPAGKKKARVSFKLSDTGVGIPANKLKTIFEPFRQADSSMNRIFGGAGLGLAISQKLANKMGGIITVSSTPGEGSVFDFSLVLEVKEVEETPVLSKVKKDVAILLVEDNAINSKLAKAILQKKGWEVELARNGVEAVEMYKGKPFDLIFMDVQMPIMDGFESTKLIREIEKKTGVHTPIITMTAHFYPGYDKVCFESGMDGLITKPFKPERLYEIVEFYMDKRSAKN